MAFKFVVVSTVATVVSSCKRPKPLYFVFIFRRRSIRFPQAWQLNHKIIKVSKACLGLIEAANVIVNGILTVAAANENKNYLPVAKNDER